MAKSQLLRLSVLVGCLLPSHLPAQQAELRELRGRLVLVIEEVDKAPLANVKLSVVGVGSDITNDEGYFRIPLPPGYRSGPPTSTWVI